MRRARSQLTRAAAMSRLVDHVAGAHVPAVGGVQLAGGLQVFGNQGRILVHRLRRTFLDRGGQAPVPLGAIGFQLRFVGHRADQRMAEGVLGARGEPHLIDQLRPEQLVENRIDAQCGEQVGAEAGADHRRRVQRLLGRGGQPVDARLDGRLHRGRHRDVGDIRATDILTVLTGQHPALHQLAHHLLGEERVPGGPLGDDRRQLADRGVGPQQLTEQRRGVRITQWGQALSSAHHAPASAPPGIRGGR